jgi:hypothetical protein
MIGYNMPPGVSESDIPGNRPEDALDEQILDDLFGALQICGVRVDEEIELELGDRLAEIVHKHMDGAVQEALSDARMRQDAK